MSPERVLNLEDLRLLARSRLPRVVYEFVAGGAEDDATLRANRDAFERIRFAPRMLVDISRRSQHASVLGRQYDSPFGIAPTGAAGLVCHNADLALARAARVANVPFILSTHSFIPLARVAS